MKRNSRLLGRSHLLAVLGLALAFCPASAEEPDAAYTRVITQRADRILEPMGLEDPAVYARVQGIIKQLYRDLSSTQDARDAAVAAIRGQTGLPPRAADAATRALREAVDHELLIISHRFTGELSAVLPPEQVLAVKDGITYGVVPLTYGVYMEMLPDLTADERHFIMAQLAEAREHAVTAGSSHGRHRVFGQAKGRINNMLSAAGYDLKQAEADMRERTGS
ncbi:MAG: DUF3826 domain-containing protein [Opitutales bacterium]|nr:DUF3826 domain-containing protein [Opitutales bacterium]